MSRFCRNIMRASFVCVFLSFGSNSRAIAADVCENLPPSTLQVLDVKAPVLEEHRMPTGERAHDIPVGGLIALHPLLVMASDVISWFDISDRMVPLPDGRVCNSPARVRLAFGTNRHAAFLARVAADDECIRLAMLDHARAHIRAFDATVDLFIDNKRITFQRGMQALKRTPSPSSQVATARWLEGLRIILTTAKEELMVELRAANAAVDAPPVLAALEAACGGKIRELERGNSL